MPIERKLAAIIFTDIAGIQKIWKMGDMFQLSIELFDTKENKIVFKFSCCLRNC